MRELRVAIGEGLGEGLSCGLRRGLNEGLGGRLGEELDWAAVAGSGQKRGSGVKLSGRLLAVAGMVTEGNSVCDVGCDHGFVSIYLIQKGISPKVIAMDVNNGPLQAAGGHVGEYGLADYIETRLSDGVEALAMGEADTLLCAGMGGRLIRRILEEGKDKVRAMKELVLQPQSEIQMVRGYLRKEGYRIVDEDMVLEEGKYYPVIKAVFVESWGEASGSRVAPGSGIGVQDGGAGLPDSGTGLPDSGTGLRDGGTGLPDSRTDLRNSESVLRDSRTDLRDSEMGLRDMSGKGDGWQQIKDKYGPVLLKKRNPVLKTYLQREHSLYMQIMENLRVNGKGKENRKEEIAERIKGIEVALSCYN